MNEELTILQPRRINPMQILLLGLAQIILWGGSYFLISVINQQITSQMGYSYNNIYGCVSIALLVSGLLLPRVGVIIQTGKYNFPIMTTGFVIAIGLFIMGLSTNIMVFLFGWVVVGIGMALGLYDALFASIVKCYHANAKQAIIWVTLISCLAPSVSWPFTNFLLTNFGWRNTCFLYALLLIFTIFPIHYFIFRRSETVLADHRSKLERIPDEIFKSKLYKQISASFTIGAVITTALVIHLIDILMWGKVEMQMILITVAVLGPFQAIARILEMLMGNRTIIEMSYIYSFCMCLGILLIYYGRDYAIPGVAIFGIGNGLRSVLRGTMPLKVYGEKIYPLIVSRLARIPLIAQAIAPYAGGLLIQQIGMPYFFAVILVLSLSNILLIAVISFELKKYYIQLNKKSYGL